MNAETMEYLRYFVRELENRIIVQEEAMEKAHKEKQTFEYNIAFRIRQEMFKYWEYMNDKIIDDLAKKNNGGESP